ncbi:MAG TPA: hypothetical protein PLS49_01515 [Candidatus Woesebacteria bacterium]|nr:hypothetical protein [Candidatus Woesebacteria bacterium]
MDQKITVKGMHCNACKALIKMEIEDVGLGNRIEEIVLLENGNVREIKFIDISDSDLEKVKSTINILDQYKVKE